MTQVLSCITVKSYITMTLPRSGIIYEEECIKFKQVDHHGFVLL